MEYIKTLHKHKHEYTYNLIYQLKRGTELILFSFYSALN